MNAVVNCKYRIIWKHGSEQKKELYLIFYNRNKKYYLLMEVNQLLKG